MFGIFNLKNKNFTEKLYIYSIIFILLFSGFTVLKDLGTYFTHYEDIFTASDILKTKRPEFKKNVLTICYDQSKASYSQFPKNLLRVMNESKYLKPFLNLGFQLAPFLIISLNSTNAPIHYLLPALLMQPNYHYRTNLFLLRFPSYLFYLLSLFLVVHLFKKLFGKDSPGAALFGLAVLAFSWQVIIYAKQGYSYEIGIPAILLFLLSFYNELQLVQKDQFNWLRPALVCALLCYAQYQVLFFVPAYFWGLFWAGRQNKRRVFGPLCQAGLFFTLLILPILYLVLFVYPEATAPYYMGLKKQFVYSHLQPNIFSGLLYFFSFFLKNIFTVIQVCFSAVTEKSVWFNIFGVFYYALFLLGCYSLAVTKDFFKKYFGVFCLVAGITWVLLVFFNKMTLSPTRHSLVLIPVFLVLLTEGLLFLLDKIFVKTKQKQYSLFVIFCIALSIFIGFLFSYNTMVTQRRDPVKEAELLALVKKYQPQTILGYQKSFNINLMPEITSRVNYYDRENPRTNPQASRWRYDRLLLFSVQQPLTQEMFEKVKGQLNQEKLVPNKLKYNLNNYRVIYKKEISADKDIGFSSLTLNQYSNGLFIYVLVRK